MHKNNQTIKVLLFLLLGLTACNKEKGIDAPNPHDGIMIPVSQVPLYADLKEYNLEDSPATRSGADEEMVSFESLLNHDKTKTAILKDGSLTYSVTQTAFRQNDENEYALRFTEGHDASDDTPTRILKYYIHAESEYYTQEFVAILVTEFDYNQKHATAGFDYLDKKNYSGTILYSTLEGQLFWVEDYTNGSITRSCMLTKKEAQEMGDLTGLIRIYLLKGFTRTWFLDCPASYCCAGLGEKPGGGGAGPEGNDGNKAAWWTNNGRHGRNNQDSAVAPGQQLLPMDGPVSFNPPQKPLGTNHKISLTSNHPDYITMLVNGKPGKGEFEKGSKVSIGFSYKYLVSEHIFSHWTGTFNGIQECEFLYTVEDTDVESTAWFNSKIPCTDRAKGVTNPLMDMSIAATGSGSIIGGTYGDTRYDRSGKIKFHDGIDIAAEPGTAVFAMYSGQIVNIFSSSLARQMDNSYGNTITVRTILDDGTVFHIVYAHLAYGDPTGYNPRFGRNFAVNDYVFRGEILGYTGKTGNAWDDDVVPNKHLHLRMYGENKNQKLDPAAFSNGIINTENGKFTNIKCE